MRTITLELLRHGPAHNQLLSPLTPYLALCENRPAVTVHVPFEHNQLLHRLRALSYQSADEQARIFQLQDTARAVGDILAQVPGLIAELSNTHEEGGVTQLRLILSASELALLPFEMALSPGDFPGAGQHLLLQPNAPLCLTRESRRSGAEPSDTYRPPRILFIAAAPAGGLDEPGVGSIPIESHLLALRRAIAPWVKYFPEDDREQRKEAVARHLVVLPNASIETIERECSRHDFTHIHLLAHGVERAEGFDRRFYVALHDPHDPSRVNYVSGRRLATALRVARVNGKGFSRPSVVTLASCDSGNVGSVAGAGSSIAHALHEAGIPVVVGSQFPLSFAGSVRLVELLYEGLLWGEDPRLLLHDLRLRLFSQFTETHDWAGLTAYISLPPGYDEQRNDIQLKQAKSSNDAARTFSDMATSHVLSETAAAAAGKASGGARRKKEEAKRAQALEESQRAQALEVALGKILAVRERLESLRMKKFHECKPKARAELLGLIASTEKQEAELLFVTGGGHLDADAERAGRLQDSNALLAKARDHYWEAFEQDRANIWTVTQYLSLAMILERLKERDKEADKDTTEGTERDIDLLWSLSYLHARFDPSDIWSYGTLTELYLLSALMKRPPEGHTREKARQEAIRNAEELVRRSGGDLFKIYSTGRQILRYVKWYSHIAELGPLVETARQILKKFPPSVTAAVP